MSLGERITEAWLAVMRESDRREALQISTLHDWKRTRGRWKDIGWSHHRPSFWWRCHFPLTTQNHAPAEAKKARAQ